jgi:transcription-repair coupling factor (superfamily II helicase)
MTENPWTPTLPDGDRTELVRLASDRAGCFIPCLPPSAAAYLAVALPGLLARTMVVVLDGPGRLDAFAQDVAAFAGGLEPVYYPPWERLPGLGGPPTGDQLGDRLDVLHRCTEPDPPALILTCVQALLQKTLAPADLDRHRIRLRRGGHHDFQELLARLQTNGYTFEPEVAAKGQAAYRGGIIDCWPPSEDWPVRLEFSGTELESVRAFHPEDQRSIQRLDAVTLMPARETADRGDGPAGATATLLDYLPERTGWLWHAPDDLREHARLYEELVQEAGVAEHTISYRQLRAAVTRRFPTGALHLGGAKPRGAAPLDLAVQPLAGLPALARAELTRDALETARHQWVDELERAADQGETVRLYFGTPGTLDRFVEWRMPRRDPRERLTLLAAPLSEGFHYVAHGLRVVSEHDLYGQRRTPRGRYDPHTRRAGPRKLSGPRLADWHDIQPGELVVHIEHGIGRYQGLLEIETPGGRQEVLSIEYADHARVHLPVSQAHLLSRYVGFGRQRPPLHRLGGKRWTREKIAAELAVRDLAGQLLETQAARQTLGGHAFAADNAWQHEFEETFPYEETPDQIRAVRDVKADMEQARPMDRLICGDVGYGKTEVAMRAAFKAVLDGRQVALLVPTTILAQQHTGTFRERMAAFPVRIEMLSRFRTPAEQRRVVEDLAAGAVDIVIGTHRLIQPDIAFKNLGLVIVDEEQRFGVEHKEHLKTLRQLVDVLTMTATPIPRTLYLSMAGVRDISTIQTPPQERLPVETIVTEYRDEVVRDAIRRELSRDGQVFFLHNRVRTIERMKAHLQTLVPEARIAVGHGQMHERELESVMTAFVRGDYDLLLCTTIIESGVDIPNVNTIFIDRADRFGLSELYQLRGRVGRYRHKAFAYLLLPRHGQLFAAARERVRAIRSYSGLGAGFQLALRDMEIRGAGNILGAEQSGHISAVGFDLYCQFLKRTVARLRGETPPPIIDVEVRLDFIHTTPGAADREGAAVIPVEYVEDESVRVNLYRRIAGLATPDELADLRAELQDRLGALPEPLARLLQIAAIRVLAQPLDIREIEVRDGKLMMKRAGRWLMRDNRFPRLTAPAATGKLAEIVALLQSPWAAAGH